MINIQYTFRVTLTRRETNIIEDNQFVSVTSIFLSTYT